MTTIGQQERRHAGSVRVDFGAPAGLGLLRDRPESGRGRARVTETDPDANPEPCGDDRAPIVVATTMGAFADGLVGWLSDPSTGWTVTGVCTASDALVATVDDSRPAVVVATDEVAAPATFMELVARLPTIKVLVLCAAFDAHVEASLVRSGVGAVLPASVRRGQVIDAVSALLGGRAVVSAEALHLVALGAGPGGVALTKRQREVLELLALGSSTAQIAERLVVTPSTVKTHIKLIGERFGVSGQLAVAAHAHRLLNPAVWVGSPPGFVHRTM